MDETTPEISGGPLGDQPQALRWRRVHEVCGSARAAFAMVQAAHLQGPLLWIQPEAAVERPDPFGLARFIDPARVILTLTPREEDVFWAMEEALRSGAAPLVVAEAAARGPHAMADLTRSRRLQLAAEAGGALGVMLTSAASAARNSNAAETRWLAEPASGRQAGEDDAALKPVWRWRLLKNKRGGLGAWRVRWLKSEPWNALQSRPEPGVGPLKSARRGRGAQGAAEQTSAPGLSASHAASRDAFSNAGLQEAVQEAVQEARPQPVGMAARDGAREIGAGEIEVGDVGECWEPWRVGEQPSHLVVVAAEGRGRECVAA
ncbi:MAG: hypothetical protein AAF909_06615 [Pseudomonadota bacterium]